MRAENNSVAADIKQLRKLLEMEYKEELGRFSERFSAGDILKMKLRGDCRFPIRFGATRYNYLNRFEVDVIDEGPVEGMENDFEYGKPVVFFTVDAYGKIKLLQVKATVWQVGDGVVKVIFSDASLFYRLAALYEDIGMKLYFDNVSYQLMFEALDGVLHAEGRLQELRNILKGDVKPVFGNFPGIRLPWLNPSQEAAVNNVVAARDVAVVHGPPGTGKTTTLVEAIVEILHRETQVMVCAQSNTAVDWISRKLVERGVSLVRIGNQARVTDHVLPYSYERRFESHPDYTELWSIRKKLRERGEVGLKGEARDRLRDRADEIESRIKREILSESKVIASTLIGSANHVLEGMKFSTLFIDEAAQALEPASWVAISKCSRVIFAGDHWQLPPTVKCYEAEKAGLGKSLMMKLAESKPGCVTLLDIQYRMHRDIMRFPSKWFYGGKIKSASGVGDNCILPFDPILEWNDTSVYGCSESSCMENGFYNKREAELTVRVLKNYIDRIGTLRIKAENIDFGIISPYRAQVYVLRQLIKSDPVLKKLKNYFTVQTVDGFQGQERDVVLISLVRANAVGNIGFLRDLRRMNVAMTRARMKLIVVGNVETLSRHPFYSGLVGYIQETGSIVTDQIFEK